MNELQKRSLGISIEPQVHSTTGAVNGTAVDLQQAVGTIRFVGRHGTITTGDFAWKIQDSADNSTFADVSGDTVAASTADNAWVMDFQRDSRAYRRYVRIVVTGANTPSGLVAGFVEYTLQVV